MDLHMPLGRKGDTPENPWDDMDAPLVPMNEGMGLAKTMASFKGSFKSVEGAAAENAAGSSGPEDKVTPPGGKSMLNDMGSYQPLTTQMMYSKEGDKSYTGPEAQGKVLKGDVSQLEHYGI